ncbi:ribosomal 60S subunit protein L13A [Sugiyamaella lignohabitans]|uniref:60S ribosomal protein L13 n=1 Tax=Sugiyamaella lignohabitans TaxID=796027 RepID=A0A170QYQ1_9ASCO|nr:ribosomal 60S subunit protein L13A [Sugiyamaella lignohabitans]ANB15988.1 ribosomal 60S subunit protein L13A [Sugiyamaella lignohabitans]
MAIGKNYPIIKNHFRKHWQERVKTHFDQAGKKASRRVARVKRAAQIAPRPLDLLRPVVRAPTVRYNRKVRAGRGFTLEELKAAGIPRKVARTVGIAVDHRRQNRSVEGFETNVNRLKEYKAKLIVFPRKAGKPKSGDASAEEIAAAKQQLSVAAAFPIAQTTTVLSERAITEEDKNVEAYKTLRIARSNAKYAGIREKRAKDKAEAEAEKKK